MLIRRAPDVRSSEITSEAAYWSRREWLAAVGAAGLGVALCIPYAASLVEVYGLKMSPLGHPEVRRGFDVFTRRGRSLSPAAQSFLDFIGPKIRAMPYLR